jgi:hypothetical protein
MLLQAGKTDKLAHYISITAKTQAEKGQTPDLRKLKIFTLGADNENTIIA